MKNLNKVFAMLLVVAMVLTSVVFADFSDVATDSVYAEAVNVGAALGLFNGYEDGTFKPEGDITRAEFAAIVVRALNQEAQAASAATTPSDFADVADDHWAKGYINIVSKMGIVNGYGDGNFGPGNNVLFEEAVKMLVVALGYEPAIGSAGYPVGYLTKAADIGLTDGVAGANGVAANRGIVAQLVVNALDTPVMKQTGYGTWVDYIVCDGYNDTQRETLLVDTLGLVKLSVSVDESSTTKSSGSKYVDEYVDVTLKKNYSERYTDKIFKWDGDKGAYTTARITVGETDLSGLVGANAIVYAAYNPNKNDDPVAVYAAKDTTKTYEMTVTADQRSSVTNVDGEIVLKYWESETDRKESVVTISADAKVYVNGGLAVDGNITDAITELSSYYGVATLQNLNVSTATSDYDTVFIDTYETLVVDENNTTRSRVTSKNDTTAIVYDPEDSDVTAKLYDENGEEMAWEDLVEFDVVSIKKYDNGSKTLIEGTKLSTTVSGAVTSISGSGMDTDFVIGGEEYGVADVDLVDEIALGDEGIFYLDILGNIAYFEATTTANSNYAFVIKVAQVSNGLEEKTALKLYTFDGQYGTVNVASKVKLDGVSGIDGDKLTDGDGAIAVTKTSFNDASWNSLVKKQGDADIFDYNEDTDTLTIAALAEGDVITYTMNSSGLITSIDRPAFKSDYAAGSNLKGKFVQNTTEAVDLEYDANKEGFSGAGSRIYIDDKTVVMVADLAAADEIADLTEDDFNLFSTANLLDEQVFEDAYVYNVDENTDVAGFILVTKDVEVEGQGAIMALVSGVGSANNDEGDPIYNVRVVQDGLVKDGKANAALTTVDDTVDIPVYSTIIPKYNAAGEIKDAYILATYSDGTVDFDDELIEDLEDANDKVDYFYGEVAEISRKTVDLVGGDSFAIESATYVYVYDDGLKAANSVRIEDLSYVSYDDDEDAFYVGKEEVSVYAIAREYDGDLLDVVLYVVR